jgi:hypothetical protein
MKSTRRRFIQSSAAGALTSALTSPVSASQAASGAGAISNLILTENAQEGSLNWQLTRVRLSEAKGYRSSLIEGYCSRQSVKAGENLEFFVSTKPAARFEIEVFRTGYYGGRGARLMTKLGPFDGKTQPDPPVGERRLRECAWEPCTTLKIPGDWTSGVYLGRLTTIPDAADKPYWQSYVIFVVKDDRKADILFQVSDNTWQAYNRWPDSYSLYTDPRAAHAPDVAVSFDRPYGKYAQIFEAPQSIGSGEFLLWEFPLSYWLEEQGYDVTYCSNSDTMDAANLARCKVFLSPGHDEYWDERQYFAVKDAIAEGMSVLWLSANSVFAVSPFEPSSGGTANRIIWRKGVFGGLTAEEMKSAERVVRGITYRGPDESAIIGARTIIPFNGGGDWICEKPEHWAFAGTGMKKGDCVRGLVGWEHHGAPANISGLEVLAKGTVWASGTTPANWTATLFEGPKNNLVFNAATIFWNQALSSPPGHMLPWSHWSRPHGVDDRVQKITANVLNRALS